MIRSLSGVTTDAAPTGARSSGDDIGVLTIEMRRSRSVTPCSMRGTIRHCSKASRVVPHGAAFSGATSNVAQAIPDIAFLVRRSRLAASVTIDGARPRAPPDKSPPAVLVRARARLPIGR